MSIYHEEETSSRFQTAPASPILELPNGASIDQVQNDSVRAALLKTKLQDQAYLGNNDSFQLPTPAAAQSPSNASENDGFPFFSKDTTSKLAPTNAEFENTDYHFKPIVPSITDNQQGDTDPDQQNPKEPVRKSISFARTPSEAQELQQAQASDIPSGSGADGLKTLVSRLIPRMKSFGLQGTTTVDSKRQTSEPQNDSTSNQDVTSSEPSGPVPQRVVEQINPGDERAGFSEESGTKTEMLKDSSTPEPASKRRRIIDGIQTEPTTPKRAGFSSETFSSPGAQSEHRQFFSSSRSSSPRAHVPQHAVSEDEARSNLDTSGWRQRSSAWVQSVRHPGQSAGRRTSTQDASGTPRPSNLRRITGRRVSQDNTDASQSTWRVKSQEGAQKWRQLRTNLRLMVRERRKAANLVDHTKSAELVAELLAGSPAALILASKFQPDEGKRIPVLLEQLKISITDSEVREGAVHERNPIFRIELEYGSGIMRMKWTIYRTLRDFWGLHGKYAAEASLQRFQRHISGESSRVKLPRFPRTAFPYFRDFRGLAEEEEEDEEEGDTGDDGNDTDKQTPVSKHKRRRSSAGFLHGRRSSVENAEAFAVSGDVAIEGEAKNLSSANKGDRYAERSRKKLETYLRNLVRFVIFRPGSNRMCRFLELSALGIRLAVEGGYHGKEGRLMLQSGKGIDFRRAWVPDLMMQRHKPMWFLVRHSYIVCVDSPAEMNIYDVFLVDSEFVVTPKRPRIRDQKKPKDIAKTAGHAARHPQHHTLRITNSERKLKLGADSERQMMQFDHSIRFMLQNTEWAKPKRFESFAPVRKNVFAQWLVDGRDYMWNLSRALNMARDVIYIHDWWLSPELFMRRPGPISHKWRLDRILKRKAEEGVKIFIIVYRNINSAIPIDSEYTKFALLDLHPNIFVQRSPNQVRQNVFFWAHHEKMCVIDHTILFCGGIDLCYGRWDTPSHSLVDDRPTGWEPTDMPLNADTCQLWPGKDYSNARAGDFFRLDEPFGEMYDRTRVPRMPWHDIGFQAVGQPARDATRHFIQRWNYILRQRKPSRPTPFLLPPPDFKPGDLEALGLEGTCTVQVLRSSGDWSMGTSKTEHSIMNAYCKLIETSEHFVYMENQFFVTSCVVEGTRVHNAIGDALVERIIRAHRNDEDWLAVIIIPLMPGFENAVDAQDGTSVRLIMQAQYRSICRGSTSIFERVRAAGVNPEDYISFYALRNWAKIGPTKAIVTEQLYIHAKCMVVDDRHAIIGSANINERSMLGDRDSELACAIFDTDMIDSVMGGERYKVGRFPHTLRMRLMREHLGIDVDQLMENDKEEESTSHEAFYAEATSRSRRSSSQSDEIAGKEPLLARTDNRVEEDLIAKELNVHTFNHDADWIQENNPHLKTNKAITADRRVTNTLEHKQDVEGYGVDNMHLYEGQPEIRGRDTVLMNGREIMVNDVSAEGRGSITNPLQPQQNTTKGSFMPKPANEGTVKARLPPAKTPRLHTQELGLTLLSQLPPLPITDDTDIGGPPLQRSFSRASADTLNPILSGMRRPIVEKDCMRDPLNDAFFRDTWNAVAKNNTRLYRHVFRCMPDSEVTTWAQYNAAVAHAQRFNLSQGMTQGNSGRGQDATVRGGPVGHGLQQSHGTHAAAGANANKTDGGGGSPTTDEKRSSLEEKSATSNEKAQERHRNQSLEIDQSNGGDQGLSNKTDALNEKLELEGPAASNTAADIYSPATSHQSTTFASADRDNATISSHQTVTDTKNSNNPRRRRRATTRSSGPPPRGADTVLSKADAEELMKLVQGHLVEWPYDWLSHEERGGKWLYSVDQMAPMEIYD